jgi:MFS family permease
MQKALWLLTIANLLNYLDRYIISSVAPKIEAEFGLTHAQTGLVMSAFMVGYMVTSPFFGWLGDRFNRPKLMSLGIFVWSLATALSGYVQSYIPLLLSRVVVGVGEASYATISPSYIRDRLRDERLVNRAMAFFYTAIPIGAAAGYMWGGYMAEHYDWRLAFYIGALPGLVLGVFVYRMLEPERILADGVKSATHETLKESIKSLLSNRTYRLTVFGYTAHTFGLGGFAAWAPHYSATALGSTLAQASFKIGAITVVAGVIGTILGGRLGDKFLGTREKSGIEAAQAFNRFCAITSVVAFPFAIWMLFASTLDQFIIAMFFVQVAMFGAVAPINTATLAAVSPSVAASAFAVQIFIIHALGDVISPPLVGWLADRIPMNQAMVVLAVAVLISAAFWWRAGTSEKGTSHGENSVQHA